MNAKIHHLARTAAVLATVLACAGAAAASTQTVVQSSDYGTLSQPYTQGFSLSLAPMDAGDVFLSDYGFSIDASSSFSSAVLTFDLGTTFQISDLTVSLLSGSAWSASVPSDLSASQIADRDSRIVASASGSSLTQSIAQITLGPGSYVVEISGQVTGTNGGSYGGVLNVSAVPEPTGFALALAGFGLLAIARRRAGR